MLKAGSNKSYVIRNGSVIANLSSTLDDRISPPVATVQMTGHSVGDLLNNAGITWGWFYGDFTAQPGSTPTHAVCTAAYDGHYDPFQYYPSTANPHHLPPTSTALIGRWGTRRTTNTISMRSGPRSKRATCRPSVLSRRRLTRPAIR